jgi:hypothetical protein
MAIAPSKCLGESVIPKKMVPLYAARIEDLGPGDFAKVDCAGCEHTGLLAHQMLIAD